jgi:hypothetical protein
MPVFRVKAVQRELKAPLKGNREKSGGIRSAQIPLSRAASSRSARRHKPEYHHGNRVQAGGKNAQKDKSKHAVRSFTHVGSKALIYQNVQIDV